MTVRGRSGFMPGAFITDLWADNWTDVLDGSKTVITSPPHGSLGVRGQPAQFTAQAFAAIGRTIASYRWHSDKDGDFSTAQNPNLASLPLSIGQHTITLYALDDQGNPVDVPDSITFTVAAHPAVQLVRVDVVDALGRAWPGGAVEWATSDAGVLGVQPVGPRSALLTAVGAGTAVATATLDPLTLQIPVTVVPAGATT